MIRLKLNTRLAVAASMLLLPFQAFSQKCLDWQWVIQPSLEVDNRVNLGGLTSDPTGNVYVTGSLHNTASFGSTQLTSAGYHDVIIAKANKDGEWLWAISAGGSGAECNSTSIAADASGNTYITGDFNGSITFGATTLTSSQKDVFVAKVSANGQWEWAVKGGGSSTDAGRNIVTDPTGDIYISGSSSNGTFGNSTLQSTGDFIAKLNNSGKWEWAISTVNRQYLKAGQAKEIVAGTDGSVYYTGTFYKSMTLGGQTLTLTQGDYSAFVAKINTEGVWQWVTNAPPASNWQSNSYSNNIIIDGKGNLLVAGGFSGQVQFGINQITSTGAADFFVARINPTSGAWQGILRSAVDGAENATSITSDPSGSVFIHAITDKGLTKGPFSVSGSSLVAKVNIVWDNYNEQWQWLKNTPAGIIGYIAPDVSGGLYFIHDIQKNNQAVFGSKSVLAKDKNIVLARIAEEPISLQATGSKNIKCGESAQMTAIAKGYDKVLWSPAAGLDNPKALAPMASPQVTTDYTVTAYNSCGDSLQSTVKISVDSLTLSVNSSKQTIVCGDAAQLTATTNTSAAMSYTWTPVTGLSNPSIANPLASPIQTTTYTVTATTANGCSASSQFTVNVNPLEVTASAANTTINCGESTTLSGTANFTGQILFVWTPAAGLDNPVSQNPTAKPSSTTTYTVTASTANGCMATHSITINVSNPNPPHVGLTSSTGEKYFCNSGLTLSAGNGFASYQWNTGETSQTIVPGQPGTYVVEVISQDGCSNKDSITLVPLAKITAKDGFYFCPNQQGANVLLDAGASMDSYMWSTGQATRTISVSQSGTYSVTVTRGSCQYSTSVVVKEHPGYTDAGFTAVHAGLNVSFFPVTQGIRFLDWNFGDGKHSAEIEATHKYDKPGTYDVCLELTDFCGFTAKQCKSITVKNATAIPEYSFTNLQAEIYPNPASYSVTVKTGVSGKKTIRIADLTGRMAIPAIYTAQEQITIDVSTLAKGVYIISVNQITQKLIIQ